MDDFDIYEILKLLPHRYPFLLVDRVVEYEEFKWVKAYKNVTVNEPCFTGHFPEYPVFPGVLILEAMAQTTGLLAFKSDPSLSGSDKLYLFAGVDDARFKRQVVPGDRLDFETHLIKGRRGIYKFDCKAFVDGELACSAIIMAASQDKPK